jgi:hypothetical protein
VFASGRLEKRLLDTGKSEQAGHHAQVDDEGCAAYVGCEFTGQQHAQDRPSVLPLRSDIGF